MKLGSIAATAASALVIGMAGGAAVFAGPSMATNWTSTELDQAQCMQRAERIARDAGLGRNLQIVGQSVFGQSSGYTAVVRCIAEKGLVYFAVGGPDLNESKRRMRALFDKF
jgi:hypothetical protein